MAVDSYLSKTDLAYFWGRIKNFFAKQADLTTLSSRVDDLVSEGGEPNVIESVKVNGTALPVTNKAVDVSVPTTIASLSDADDWATKEYVAENGGTIQTVKVNGAEQMITDHAVDISVPTTVASLTDASNYALVSSVPTAVSALTNDSGYQTASDVSTAINTAVASAYKYKASVATMSDLPTDAAAGDVYDVQATGMNYAWNGTAWDALGQYVDVSSLWSTSDLVAITTAEIDAIIDSE